MQHCIIATTTSPGRGGTGQLSSHWPVRSSEAWLEFANGYLKHAIQPFKVGAQRDLYKIPRSAEDCYGKPSQVCTREPLTCPSNWKWNLHLMRIWNVSIKSSPAFLWQSLRPLPDFHFSGTPGPQTAVSFSGTAVCSSRICIRRCPDMVSTCAEAASTGVRMLGNACVQCNVLQCVEMY